RFLEPKGIYLLEAMACGLPCVVPSRGAFPEMIDASGGGLLCEPDDAADLARRLGELLDDPEAALRFGEAGRAWVEAETNRSGMAEATAAVFASCLAV